VKSAKEKLVLALKKGSVRGFVLIVLVFTMSIGLLLLWEKQKLDAEFERIVASSLNTNTQHTAVGIKRDITGALKSLKTAEALLLSSEAGLAGDIQERLDRNSGFVSGDFVTYLSTEEIEEGKLPISQEDAERLQKGVTVISAVVGEGVKKDLVIIRPLTGDSGMIGALCIRLKEKNLLSSASDGGVYQNPYSCVVTGSGEIIYNTYQPEHRGNLFDDLRGYGLSETEAGKIAIGVMNGGSSSAAFFRKGDTYFLSSAHLEYNGWYLVTVVRGPDVLLRSAVLFRDVVTTSITTVLITVSAAGIVFYQLLSNKEKLKAAQRSNRAFASRFQAMFEQHSALKVVIDADTGEIMDANPALLRYFGFEKQEMLGKNVQELNLLPGDIQLQKIHGKMDAGALFVAAPHRLRSGETRLLDVYASEIWDKGRRLLYAILFDVTQRESYREELLREKELLHTTLQSIGDGVVTTDRAGIITGINAVSERLTGWGDGQALGRPFSEVFVLRNEETGRLAENPVQKVLETGLVMGLANHTELVDRQGRPTPIADSAAPIRGDESQDIMGVVMVFRDVSSEKAHSREIEFLSYHDSLTGLYNRRYIEETMSRMDAAGEVPVSVIMADVNGLKITNDVFGHSAGDALLKSVAKMMRECSGRDDFVARLGGDEFVILMPGKGLEEAEAVIRRIRNIQVEIKGSSLALSLSLGCACKDGADTAVQAALQRAEEYMYQQKLLDGKSYRNAIISTLLATLYEKSNETEEHSKRLEKYCHAVGKKLQLSFKEMDELSLLALLHDVGKVGVNPDILRKPGPLTDAEWGEMKRHPEIGFRIAQATPELSSVAELILAHHERWDGGGYPRGLKGEEIPMACRILAVTDAYDAMIGKRVYRPAVTVEQAAEEIRKNMGTQFDPQMAGLLLEVLQEERGDLFYKPQGGF